MKHYELTSSIKVNQVTEGLYIDFSNAENDVTCTLGSVETSAFGLAVFVRAGKAKTTIDFGTDVEFHGLKKISFSVEEKGFLCLMAIPSGFLHQYSTGAWDFPTLQWPRGYLHPEDMLLANGYIIGE